MAGAAFGSGDGGDFVDHQATCGAEIVGGIGFDGEAGVCLWFVVTSVRNAPAMPARCVAASDRFVQDLISTSLIQATDRHIPQPDRDGGNCGSVIGYGRNGRG